LPATFDPVMTAAPFTIALTWARPARPTPQPSLWLPSTVASESATAWEGRPVLARRDAGEPRPNVRSGLVVRGATRRGIGAHDAAPLGTAATDGRPFAATASATRFTAVTTAPSDARSMHDRNVANGMGSTAVDGPRPKGAAPSRCASWQTDRAPQPAAPGQLVSAAGAGFPEREPGQPPKEVVARPSSLTRHVTGSASMTPQLPAVAFIPGPVR
jgi:hypothetical protein